MEKQKIQKRIHMTKTLPNGDIISTETIGDRIRKLAKTPSVIRNRRLLKAMSHITKREKAFIRFTVFDALLNNGTKSATVVNVHCFQRGTKAIHKIHDRDELFMFPINSYDPVTNEPPTIGGRNGGFVKCIQ